ncbi:molybdopterin cofactor-binding domain-containing protein [Amycolatopsis anabasis]|uniref:molybdopterin cofactor-binding domain-containing protein n=1 Tax=Amycolatopsis anabasis TaxID=1840409 RepID=UPI001C5519A2|nr:molybdopterin cofactor-binding domain-containing protein [Amycolatopsis anabasis]
MRSRTGGDRLTLYDATQGIVASQRTVAAYLGIPPAKVRVICGNTMSPTFTRGPGEASGMIALECTLDEVAHRLGIDPLEIRIRNHAELDPESGNPWSSDGALECYRRAAERFGWANASLGEYLVPVNMDAPDVDIEFVEVDDSVVNPLGVKGIGELGMIGAAAAIVTPSTTPPESACATFPSASNTCSTSLRNSASRCTSLCPLVGVRGVVRVGWGKYRRWGW